MQSICSATVLAILAVANPAPCSAANDAISPAVASAQPQQMASNTRFGLPGLPRVPKVPKVPKVAPPPTWP
ncbi:hypothetical protein BH11PSE3_BH11PSE3_32670 [soil metagenome]